MTRVDHTDLHGIYPATICPLTPSHDIDEASLASHISSLAEIPGVRGLLVNGHAGENYVLDRDEKRRVVEIARQSVSDDTFLVCGVNAESTREAAKHAQDVEAAGGNAILIFPPNSWALSATPDVVVAHHEGVISASELPIFLYQAPVSTGPMAYSHDIIRDLVALPRVVAIKEGSWEVAAYEANRRLVQECAPHVAVMASGDEHLMTSFLIGSEGSLVSLAIIVPELIIALDNAVRQGDLNEARKAHDIIQPLARAIYGTAPTHLANARLKTCLRLLGRLECDAMRLPIGTLPQNEIDTLRRVLMNVGLLSDRPARAMNA